MEKIINITEAYDKRDPNPAKNYGIHGADLRMILKGELGAVQFVLYTNRHLPEVQADLVIKRLPFADIKTQTKLIMYSGEFGSKETAIEEIVDYQRTINSLNLGDAKFFFEPLPADLGYHSPVPQYEVQLPTGVSNKWDDDYNNIIGTEGECKPCEYLNGKCCYYDGSGLNAQPVYERMLQDGEAGVWSELEQYYIQVFDELK